MTYDNTNTGAIFFNHKKKGDKSPDRTGTLDVGGTKYRIACWDKTSAKGVPFISLRIELEEKPVMDNTKSFADTMQGKDVDDGVPF